MWICIRCRAELDPDIAAPEMDDFGLYFICPYCGRRNRLRTAGRDEYGLLLLEQIDSDDKTVGGSD